MIPGLRIFKQASVEVRVSEAIPEHLRDSARELFDLRSGNPGKGHGSALMRAVCAEADALKKVLMLLVTQADESENARLAGWYERFGFTRAKDSFASPVLMIRAPRATWSRLEKKPIASALEMY